MSRVPRRLCECDMYHVFARGVGRQIIFEDYDDRIFFVDLLRRKLQERAGIGVELLAWCLMDNHFHLLVHAKMPDLSNFMKSIEVAYARRFNERYDRGGCLFQGRFGSEPIQSESQLLAAVRYIHLNPQKAGVSSFAAYPWSSYAEYRGTPAMTRTDLVLSIAGTGALFERFHEVEAGAWFFMEENSHCGGAKRRLSDAEARQMLSGIVGADWRAALLVLSREERNNAIAQLKSHGATVRQIERLTGIGRGIIARVETG